ncbi:hypothetical protein G9A89_019875 [Geosiphon pyriformis]|nr:hypothetical protein G9A89_019875 [Geosiphon pyriformis]
MCNVQNINVPVKQKNIIHWHRDSGNLIRDKFNRVRIFSSGLDKGFLGTGVTIIMNTSLACHISKVLENKLSVSILELYAGASMAVHFFQANDINFVIAKVVNESFVCDGSRKCASFKKCLDLGLVNFLDGSSFVKLLTWANSWDVAKTIDFLFISLNLVNAIVDCKVSDVGEFFDIDYHAVFMSNNFKDAISANAAMLSDKFAIFASFLDLDVMWNIIRKIMVFLADKMFKKKWFKGFNNVFTKGSLRFHKLELLVSRIVRVLHEKSIVNFDFLMRCWISLDNAKASVVQNVVNSGAGSGHIHSALFVARKFYCAAKLAESLRAREANIRSAIDKRIESFKTNKGHTIRSVLEHPFHKVVLNYLVVDDELILESNSVKSKIDIIIEE